MVPNKGLFVQEFSPNISQVTENNQYLKLSLLSAYLRQPFLDYTSKGEKSCLKITAIYWTETCQFRGPDTTAVLYMVSSFLYVSLFFPAHSLRTRYHLFQQVNKQGGCVPSVHSSWASHQYSARERNTYKCADLDSIKPEVQLPAHMPTPTLNNKIQRKFQSYYGLECILFFCPIILK